MNFHSSRTLLSLLRACALVLLLVVAQLGALSHALGHLKSGDDGGQTPETFCEWCATYAHGGDALPGGCASPLLASASVADELPMAEAPLHPFPFVAYLSQAPPSLS